MSIGKDIVPEHLGDIMLPNQPEIERHIHDNMKYAYYNGFKYCYFMNETLADLAYSICEHENKSRVFDIYDLYFFSNSKQSLDKIYH